MVGVKVFDRPSNQHTHPVLPSLPPLHTPHTQRLVDTAMLAAVGGLAYALGAVLRLQAYMR